MAFSSSVSMALFANADKMGASQNVEKLRSRTAEKSLSYQNDQQPLAEAQRMADAHMASKQRKPMVFEQMKSKGKWAITTMYINPERMSYQTSKVKSKQITRGGIYYNHWGDDHGVISLSGTTGYAGMEAIAALENAYYASGTLMKYTNYGPEKTDIVAGEYGVIDYNDTMGVLDTFVSTKNPTILGKIAAKYNETQNAAKRNSEFVDPTNNALAAYANNIMKTYISNVNSKQFKSNYDKCKKEIASWQKEFKTKNGRSPSAPEYYNNAVAIFQKYINVNIADKQVYSTDIIVSLAYSETISLYKFAWKTPVNNELNIDDLYKLNYSYAFAGKQTDSFQKAINNELDPPELTWGQQLNTLNTIMQEQAQADVSLLYSAIGDADPENEMLAMALQFEADRVDALRNHLIEIADWEQRERNIRSELKTKALETMDDLFNDEWAPRRIILYYENRAYIGHFDSFNYQRVANSPLINYELRFTVEKQIVGTMY